MLLDKNKNKNKSNNDYDSNNSNNNNSINKSINNNNNDKPTALSGKINYQNKVNQPEMLNSNFNMAKTNYWDPTKSSKFKNQ